VALRLRLVLGAVDVLLSWASVTSASAASASPTEQEMYRGRAVFTHASFA
jgi:hypothetical protein